MIDLDEATVTAALREMAIEDDASIDRAIDATAERARDRSQFEVEAILRAELHRQGLNLGDDTARIAERIVRAVNPTRSDRPLRTLKTVLGERSSCGSSWQAPRPAGACPPAAVTCSPRDPPIVMC